MKNKLFLMSSFVSVLGFSFLGWLSFKNGLGVPEIVAFILSLTGLSYLILSHLFQAKNLGQVTGKLNAHAGKFKGSSKEMLEFANEINKTSIEQGRSLIQTAASVEEISRMTGQTVDRIQN